jgi:hypothetical protein
MATLELLQGTLDLLVLMDAWRQFAAKRPW